MLSRAQWYREQANLALQRGHETRDPTLRASFDELVREWLRLAEQAEWIANQQQPPLPKRTSRRNRPGVNPPRHSSFYQEHLHATAQYASLVCAESVMPLSSKQEALCRRLEMGQPEPSAAALIRQQARDIDELWDRLSRAYLAVRREIPSDDLRREIEELRAHLERQRTIT